jgi:PAS domain S-box-containing protein
MKKNQPLSKEIEAIIQNPSKRWPAFSQALINASDTCMLAVNDQGIIFLSNTMAEEKLGISQKNKLKQVLPQLDERVDKTIISGIAQTDFKLHVRTNDFMASVHPLKIGQDLVGVICTLNESTAFENVIKQMHFFQNMSRELDAIINSSSDGLFVCDAKANVIRMNPASELIHKAKEKDLIGRNMKDLVDEGFIDSSAALQASQSKETVTLLQNKDNRKLISIGTPVFDEQGELIRVVVSERDITRIDQLQHELEEQASIKDQLQNQLRQIQVAELKNNQIIARSRSMLEVIERAYKVSSVDSSVLITGESGVGKGVIVNLIHNNSNRAEKPLIRINCGAIPETLIESELFGYEAGAFTGARSSGKPGSLELANHGSIFLDEIAELPLVAQVKLLRFLENGRVNRLGGVKAITVDARILAATHRDLKKMVANGTFRHDLYYRLNVIPISIPPLRYRSDCILPLLRYYVDHFTGLTGTRKRVGREALDSLLAYSYPGNVRELMNICERIVVMSETEVVGVSDLPSDVARCSADTPVTLSVKSEERTLAQTLEYVERQVLIQALKKYKSQINVSKALGVSQPTIARRLKKYNIALAD